MRFTTSVAAASVVAAAQAITLDVSDASSIKTAAGTIAKSLMSTYTSANTVGLLPKPYYWWEAGAMFGSLISYSSLTGDHQYDSDISKAIYSQASPTTDFMMADQHFDLGNDDQAFWGLTAMSAAEHSLTVPSGAPSTIWLDLASNTFNDIVGRWNTSFCGGGIKWQFYTDNKGFNYKSSIANGATMQLAARLALYTSNQTYAHWAGEIYDWMSAVGFMDESNNYFVYDGAGDDPDNCTKIDKHQWSYNAAAMLGGAAAMANYSGPGADSSTWTTRTQGIWKGASVFFSPFSNSSNVMFEAACETVGTCNTDELSFKAYLARWAAFAGQVVPGIMSDVQSKMQASAKSAAASCSGNGGSDCGITWWTGGFDGKTGVGQGMSALETIVALLAPSVAFPKAGQKSPSSSATPTSTSAAPSSSRSAMPTTMVTSKSAPSASASASASAAASVNNANANVQGNAAASHNAPLKCGDNGKVYFTAPTKATKRDQQARPWLDRVGAM